MTYKGRDLVSWLKAYRADFARSPLFESTPTWSGRTIGLEGETQAALAHMSTNVVPALLQMLKASDSPLKRRFLAFCYKHSAIGLHPLRDADYCEMAILGFHCLGNVAKPAVPSLMKLLHSDKLPLRLAAYQALGAIGPSAEEAVPSIIEGISDPQYPVRWNSIAALGRIHKRPELVLPALFPLLSQPTTGESERQIIMLTLGSLGKYGAQARAAIPAILPLISNDDAEIRTSARSALDQIEPGAADRGPQ